MKWLKSKISVLLSVLMITFTAMGLHSCTKYEKEIELSFAPGLAHQMQSVQIWTHKLGLSIEAENVELADFYIHELEEGIEFLIDTIDEYDGFPIANLTRSMFIPALESLEDALDEKMGWVVVRERFEAVIASCNSCHVATDHGFIIITEGYGNNPFNQAF